MSEEIETTIHTDDDVRVYVSEWDDGGAWLRMSGQHGAMYTSLTREQAQQLLEGLQAVLAREVPA